MISPVQAVPERLRPLAREEGSESWSGSYSVEISESEPVFAGHYPDFPIFPGVCVMECVRRAAEAETPPPAGKLRLDSVESTRFLSAVHPGDRLAIELNWSPRGEGWRCQAKVATQHGQAATMRLRYLPEAVA
ncbi:hypothetical protein JGS22_006615 [Streptomyces sp. P38-E01]|uniref:ApeI dehydratase-like domain-containing protein n=1 Tax=Streptomyces tardus TaxID=2780544 RepID=A0A949JLH2_9ACTN|nr:hypothetical protein [Streptomyces tardus]MBU7597316.1 hypothetical protein [Streptomyces tardus]